MITAWAQRAWAADACTLAARQPGPHNGTGETTAYSFFDKVRDLPLVFRKRALHPGASIGYQLASVIAGGPAPYIATRIWAGETFLPAKNPYMISLYILLCCVIGFGAVALLKDRSQLDHTKEYEEQPEAAEAPAARRAMG